MKTTLRAKTLFQSLDTEPRALYEWLATPENLPRWHTTLCRSLKKEADVWTATSSRGPVSIRFVRNDHALVLDLIQRTPNGAELTTAIRVFPNGEGTEVVFVMIQGREISDAIFHEQTRWAENAIRSLKNRRAEKPTATVSPADTVAPEVAEESSALPIAIATPEPAVAETTASTDSSTGDTATSNAMAIGKKLFVGNLPFDWADEQLKLLFSAAGNVAGAEFARFRRNGRSRGFGFVEMATEEDAKIAIHELHGGLAGNRKIHVRLSRLKEGRTAEPLPSSSDSSAPEKVTSLDAQPAIASEEKVERIAKPQSAPVQSRPQRQSRPARPTRNSRSSGGRSSQRSEEEAGVITTGGYEYFPRRPKGSVEPAPVSEPVAEKSSAPRRTIEASPYMDDVGDIENRGPRNPRRRGGSGPRRRR